ncbi:uncharacterized protein THITE_2086135 [Thermothielavioides terrestris NRRL 8126]|uniref:Transcription factor domain-containing protein n=1 Tax=Thermothielavioides terrestris (strain ATCC 38088 / NRRL 8126) TaxID=578455 RepID=G2QVF5_THETT|nr:uncharacterized protein THITE_2086135 [Thermothielavioides terrestris NRRL 8126]AEO64645.1 hypothetical protein THITE_2086135 [Thermothielavioides terrestris NRRL 8126]
MPATWLADSEAEDDAALEEVPCPLIEPQSHGPPIRLSWPHAGHPRRAVVGKSPAASGRGSRSTEASHKAQVPHIVHVSHRDMEMHYHLTRSVVPDGLSRPTLDVPLAWNPVKLEVGHQALFEYFQHAASRSLATFGYGPTDLGNTLIRIALNGGNSTPSATAVLQGILAFSALHRHDVYSQAIELKISAIETLSTASDSNISTAEAMQHVATGMLLCSFEIHQLTCTSNDWTRYLCGVKGLIRATGLDSAPYDDDLAALLDWVYYHDVLARFSLRHWHRESASKSSRSPLSPSTALSLASSCMLRSTSRQSIPAEPSKSSPPALGLIALLSEVCDAVPARLPPMTPAERDEYKSFLQILDWRIRSWKPPIPVTTTGYDNNSNNTSDAALVTELFQLATLIYLNRASANTLNQQRRTQQHIDRGFALLARLRTCERQFPVLVLGCEAVGDEQRAVVLDAIARTEQSDRSRSFNYVRHLLQALWAQDDLAAGELDYGEKLSYVHSAPLHLPSNMPRYLHLIEISSLPQSWLQSYGRSAPRATEATEEVLFDPNSSTQFRPNGPGLVFTGEMVNAWRWMAEPWPGLVKKLPLSRGGRFRLRGGMMGV